MAQWRSYLSHLECTACGLHHDADQLQTVCTACGKVLFARYDLDGVRQAVQPSNFACNDRCPVLAWPRMDSTDARSAELHQAPNVRYAGQTRKRCGEAVRRAKFRGALRW